jgi:transmembrane sensor
VKEHAKLVNSTDWHNLSENTRNKATQWHIRLTSSDVTDAEYDAFASWFATDPDNAAVFSYVEEFSGKIEILRDLDHSSLDYLIDQEKTIPALKLATANSSLPRYAIAASLAVAFVISALFVSYRQYNPAIEQFAIAAPVDQFHTAQLSDGTTIVLAPGAELKGAFSKGMRHIESLSGVSFFDVESNAKRPFSIALGEQSVTVVGTQFEISSFKNYQSVAVAEGVVAVSTNRSAKKTETSLSAGEQILFSNAAPDGVHSVLLPAAIGVWRAGYFEFDDAKLSAIANKLNIFYGNPLFVVNQDGLSNIRFSGILILSDPAGTAHRLSELMPLEVTETDSGFLLTGTRETSD